MPIASPQRDLGLLAQMAGPTDEDAAAAAVADREAPPAHPSRRLGIYVAIVVLLVLAGVVLALAVKVGLIGGGARPPA